MNPALPIDRLGNSRKGGVKLLAIDTSADYLSLAVINGDKIIGRFHKKARMNHSRLLVPAIDTLLKKTKLKLKDIDGFALSIGPGSFTGLRISAVTVKGLAFSLRKPIVTVPTLDAIAHNIKNFRGIICPVLDARKNKVYACLYRSDGKTIKRISKYLLMPIADLMERIEKIKSEGVIFLGDISERVSPLSRAESRDRGTSPRWEPRAEVIARLGAEKFRKKQFVKPDDLEPMYLYSRECDIRGK